MDWIELFFQIKTILFFVALGILVLAGLATVIVFIQEKIRQHRKDKKC